MPVIDGKGGEWYQTEPSRQLMVRAKGTVSQES